MVINVILVVPHPKRRGLSKTEAKRIEDNVQHIIQVKLNFAGCDATEI